ncbi:hypothetical protein AMTRI_Chr13g117830 [Amborella trichopoda]
MTVPLFLLVSFQLARIYRLILTDHALPETIYICCCIYGIYQPSYPISQLSFRGIRPTPK